MSSSRSDDYDDQDAPWDPFWAYVLGEDDQYERRNERGLFRRQPKDIADTNNGQLNQAEALVRRRSSFFVRRGQNKDEVRQQAESNNLLESDVETDYDEEEEEEIQIRNASASEQRDGSAGDYDDNNLATDQSDEAREEWRWEIDTSLFFDNDSATESKDEVRTAVLPERVRRWRKGLACLNPMRADNSENEVNKEKKGGGGGSALKLVPARLSFRRNPQASP